MQSSQGHCWSPKKGGGGGGDEARRLLLFFMYYSLCTVESLCIHWYAVLGEILACPFRVRRLTVLHKSNITIENVQV